MTAIGPLILEEVQRGIDGLSAKAIWRTHDDLILESGYYRFPQYDTACVSSQVGCNVACTFCVTGLSPVQRNLTVDEVVQQAVSDPARLFGGAQRRFKVSFQGMGEPFHNYATMVGAIRRLRVIQPAWEVGVSSIGFPSLITRLAQDAPGVKLQLSLHSASKDVRRELIPHPATKIELTALLEAGHHYAQQNRRPVVLNYVLLAGRNDSFEDGMAFGSLATPSFELKLSRFNPDPRLKHFAPSAEREIDFVAGVRKVGANLYGFTSLGQDVQGGCGQLSARVATEGRRC